MTAGVNELLITAIWTSLVVVGILQLIRAAKALLRPRQSAPPDPIASASATGLPFSYGEPYGNRATVTFRPVVYSNDRPV